MAKTNGEFTAMPAPETSLEQQAIDAGIDIEAIDASRDDQSPDPRPSWLPPKFSSAEDMARSYAELEKKLRAGAPEDDHEGEEDVGESDEPGDEVEAEAETGAEEDAARKAAEAAGIDYTAMDAHYREHGDLAKEHREAFNKIGIPDGLIDDYLDGVRARQELGAVHNERYEAQLLDPIGGREAYDDMLTWAAENLSEKQVDAFNKSVIGPEAEARKAISDLKSRYDEVHGAEPKRRVSGRAASTAPRGYESMQQMVDDMRKPAYESDPAYRAKVDARIRASSNL